jgi:hypothetical protein
MNCNNVQDLLPLYAGNDLEDKKAAHLSEHLRSCAECSVLAAEYRETMRMFQQFTPPPFDEAVYSGIRQRVLQEIEKDATAPTLRQLVTNLLGQRLRWAVAASVMLAVSGFTIYFIATRTNRTQVAADQTIDRNEQPETNASTGSETDIPLKNEIVQTTTGGSGGRKYASQRKNLVTVSRRTNSLGHTADKRPKIAPALPTPDNFAVLPAPDPVAAAMTLRVEMQTKDPNIRIIWLSNPPVKQNSRN